MILTVVFNCAAIGDGVKVNVQFV